MKIYIIPAWYPQDENDITASFFREQAQALAERGHDVTVIHIEPLSVTYAIRKPWHSKRIWQDGKVRTIFHKVIIPVLAKFGKAQDEYISKVFYKIINEQIKEDEASGLGKPDLLHAHVAHSCAYYCLYAKEQLGFPLVVTEHYSGLLLGEATEREYDRVKQTIERADAFVFVGSNFQKTLCRRLNINKKTYFIPNMINTNEFTVNEHKEETITFLTACHLKKHKSVDKVVCAFHNAFERTKNVRLLIAGNGDEYNSLIKLIAELNEENRIEMMGEYSREQSREVFSSADIFVLTSKAEPFGIVYIEALASGLPCIGTKGQGADDIINDSNGFLVEYGNIAELAERMKELYNNQNNYNSEQIRNDCIKRFSKESVCEQIEILYREYT